MSLLHGHDLDCLQGTGTDTITTALAKRGIWHGYLVRCLLPEQLMGAGHCSSTHSTVAFLRITSIIVYQSHLTWHQPLLLASFAFSSSSSSFSNCCHIDGGTEWGGHRAFRSAILSSISLTLSSLTLPCSFLVCHFSIIMASAGQPSAACPVDHPTILTSSSFFHRLQDFLNFFGCRQAQYRFGKGLGLSQKDPPNSLFDV
jgi:hypothetical protein